MIKITLVVPITLSIFSLLSLSSCQGSNGPVAETSGVDAGEAADTGGIDRDTHAGDAQDSDVDVQPSPDAGSPSPQWVSLAPIAAGPRQEVAVEALNDEIYVVGGFNSQLQIVSTVEVYDPGTDTWRSAAPMPARMHHANTAVVDGKLYVVGFLVERSFLPDGRVFEYDPSLDTWTQKTSMPAGSERGASGTTAIDGQIYVVGGLRAGAVADVSRYDPAADTWTSLPDHPLPLDHLVVGALDGVLFTFGGRQRSIESHTAQVFAYSVDDEEWVPKAPMPTSRAGHAAAVLGGRVYVFGGEGNPEHPSGVFDETEVYDPSADTWQVLTPMLTRRHGTGAAAIGGTIFIPGGADIEAFAAISVNEAFTP